MMSLQIDSRRLRNRNALTAAFTVVFLPHLVHWHSLLFSFLILYIDDQIAKFLVTTNFGLGSDPVRDQY